MLDFIISLLFGMLPEVLFFTLSIIYIKDLSTNRLKLFGFLVIGYIMLIMICRYQLLFYLAYIVYVYIVLKILYKAHISDIFMISVVSSYLTLMSFIAFKTIDNYTLAYVVNRVLLFAPLLLTNFKLNDIYNTYLSLWNRSEGKVIKSVTLRNISLVFVNVFIVLLNTLVVLAMFDYSKSIS